MAKEIKIFLKKFGKSFDFGCVIYYNLNIINVISIFRRVKFASKILSC